MQILETNADGSTKHFKVFKKQTLPDDEGFQETIMCNRKTLLSFNRCSTLTRRIACGLWLVNHKEPRPPHKWTKKQNERKSKWVRGQQRRNQTGDGPSEMGSVADGTDNICPTSEPSWNPVNGRNSSGDRMDSVAEGPENDAAPQPDNERRALGEDLQHEQTEEPDLPPIRRTAAATQRSQEQPPEQPTDFDPALDPDLFRDIRHTPRTSPDPFLGSRQSPIEVDTASSHPARRTLFPSPKTRGPLGVSVANSRGKGSASSSPLKDASTTHPRPQKSAEPADKENTPPSPARPTTPDRFSDLFYDVTPSTPTRGGGSPEPAHPPPSASRLDLGLFKTPAARTPPPPLALNTGDFFSSAVKAFLHAHPGATTPQRTTPTKAAATATATVAAATIAAATASDAAPPDATPNTRRLHQLLADAASESPSRFLAAARALPPLPPSTPGRDASAAAARPTSGCSPGHLGLTPGRLFGSGGSLGLGASSPPGGWFGVYEDGAEGTGEGWSELGLGSSPLKGLEGGEWRKEGEGEKVEEAIGGEDEGADVEEDAEGMAGGGVAVAA